MEIYIIIAVLLFLWNVIAIYIKDLRNNLYDYYFIFGILLIVASLRSITVGADTKNYISFFLDIAKIDDIEYLLYYAEKNVIELGYLFFNKSLSFISHEQQTITIANSILLMYSLYYCVERNSINKRDSIFLFYCLGIYQTALNLMPSSIASIISLSGLHEMEDNKFLKYILIVVLAMQIHTSAFIFIPLYLCSKIRLTKVRALILFCAGPVFYFLYEYIIYIIMPFIPNIYLNYFESDAVFNGGVLVFHILLCVFLFTFTDFNDLSKKESTLFWFLLIELMFFWISLKMVFFARVSLLLSPCLLLLIPMMLEKNKFFNKNITKIVLYFLVMIQLIIRMSINNIGTTIPYEFFWNDFK